MTSNLWSWQGKPPPIWARNRFASEIDNLITSYVCEIYLYVYLMKLLKGAWTL